MNRLDTTDPQCVHTRSDTRPPSTWYFCWFVQKGLKNDKTACLLPIGPWIKYLEWARQKNEYHRRHSIAMDTFFCVQSKNDSTVLQIFWPKGNSVWCPLSVGALGDRLNPYPTAFPYGNGMVLHFYQQQESSTSKTVHKVINKGLKTFV